MEQSNFLTQKMEQKHIDDVFDISVNQFKSTSWTKAQFLEELKYEHKRNFVVTINDKVIAFMNASVCPDEICIFNLAVEEKFKKQGIATKLVALARQMAVENGKKRVVLEVEENNLPALKLYEKQGFNVVRKRKSYYSNGASCIEMELLI